MNRQMQHYAGPSESDEAFSFCASRDENRWERSSKGSGGHGRRRVVDLEHRAFTGGCRMDTKTLLTDAFLRIPSLVQGACDGLGVADLMYRPESGANSIAWLVWHLSRTQDKHIAEIARTEQVWADPVWVEMTGINRDVSATGFGDTPEQVAAVIPLSSAALVAYNAAVTERTVAYLAGVNGSELDRIIDESYDPPVSVGVRLVSVISDNLQHAGQARYLRGSIERIR